MTETNIEKKENESSFYLLPSYITTLVSSITIGGAAHAAGHTFEMATHYGFKFLPNGFSFSAPFVARINHELIENSIVAGVTINLHNLNSFIDSFKKAAEPIFEKPLKFIVAGVFSYYAEKLTCDFIHNGHDHDHEHDHNLREIPLLGAASFIGANVGISIYEYLFPETE
jgi:hypothetical protein